jgi:hypothetical protein
MRSTLDEFVRSMDELRSLADSIAPVNDLLRRDPTEAVRKYLVIRRRFDHAATIVVLYAAFERFVEEIVWEYAKLMASQSEYAALPEKLATKHLTKSAELLGKRLGEGRYRGVTQLDIVKNLFECLSGAKPYSLNQHAIVSHDFNLRPNEITSLFSAVGLESFKASVRKADPLLDWYCQKEFLQNPPQEGVPETSIDTRLEDLVESRNQIAHKGGIPPNVVDHAGMVELISFVEAYSRSIFVVIADAYLRQESKNLSKVIAVGELTDGPFKKGYAIVVKRPKGRVYVGQPVFALTKERPVKWGYIKEIKINDINAASVAEDSTAPELGLLLDFKCSKKAEVFLLQGNDGLVWASAKSA